MRLITSSEQRTIELAATKNGLDISEMIEAAGVAACEFIVGQIEVTGLFVLVLCGRGGNGADGFVIARELIKCGCDARILLCCSAPQGEAPQKVYAQAIEAGVPVVDLGMENMVAQQWAQSADLVVDAVFGIGFRDQLPEQLEQLFDRIEQAGTQVYAIDMPSGLNSDTGVAAAYTLKANHTLFFIGKKISQIFKSSRQYCGESHFLDIGIPDEAYKSVPEQLLELSADIAELSLPLREDTYHKGQYGSLVCIAGSDRYRGASVLCVRGALAGGCGMIRTISCGKALDTVAAHCPESILLDYQQHDKDIRQAVRKAAAFVVGPGLDPRVADQFLCSIISDTSAPVIIDAEGIHALSRNLSLLDKHNQPLILTPHLGEFSVLSGIDTEEIRDNRIKEARRYATENHLILVLKSEDTLVALPNGMVFVNTIGNSGMAKGGTGDLLSGLIGSLCAAGAEPRQAALCGVWLHSHAADLALKNRTQHTLTPSIIADFLPEAVGDLAKYCDSVSK